ncbi:MAG: hypothetical protein K2W95_09585 [Candidatus Obscuribacterales bacterium]|nr:hypothetical protein [Candidatus Obscuribacterales bacterium]
MKLARKPHGAVLSFIVAAIFVVVLVGIAFATLLMLIGGNRQGTNANDAGNLNVAKCAPLIQVSGGAAGADFLDISPTNRFDLTNINQVWGKTLLINLNEQAMQQQGLSTSASSANAAQVWARAQSISRSLSRALNTRSTKEGFHQNVADRNRVNMLTLEKSVDVSGDWRTSCMNRGTESNLNFLDSQLPPGITEASLGTPTVVKTDSKTGQQRKFWMGYRGIRAAGRFINFVPFEFEGAPHHVSLKPFVANTLAKRPMPTWTNPVPNAFESVAFVDDAGARRHTFDSVALSHVRTRTTPQVPDGFIRFRLGQDTMRYVYRLAGDHHLGGWKYPGVNTLPKLDPGPYSDTNIADPTYPTSYFKLAFSYGHQYHDPANGNEPTLFMALFGMGDPDDLSVYGNLRNMLRTRANQIKPGTTWQQIAALLHATSIRNNRGPFKLKLVGSNLAIVPDSDLSAVADGRTVRTVNGSITDSPNKLHFVEHVFPVGPIPHGMTIQKFHKTEWTHHVDMTPGTGANKALLDILQDDDAVGTFGPTPP